MFEEKRVVTPAAETTLLTQEPTQVSITIHRQKNNDGCAGMFMWNVSSPGKELAGDGETLQLGNHLSRRRPPPPARRSGRRCDSAAPQQGRGSP